MQVATCIIIYLPLSSLNCMDRMGTPSRFGEIHWSTESTGSRCRQRNWSLVLVFVRFQHFLQHCPWSMNALTIQNQDALTQGGQINLLMFFFGGQFTLFTVVRPKSFTQPLYLLHLKSLLLVQRPGVQRRSAGLKPKFQNMVLGAGSGYYRSQNWMMHTFTEKTEKLMFHGKDPGVL